MNHSESIDNSGYIYRKGHKRSGSHTNFATETGALGRFVVDFSLILIEIWNKKNKIANSIDLVYHKQSSLAGNFGGGRKKCANML